MNARGRASALGVAAIVVACSGAALTLSGTAVPQERETPSEARITHGQDDMVFPALLFARQFNAEELATVASLFSATSYRVMPTIRLAVDEVEADGLTVIGEAVLLDGQRLQFGDVMTAGDTFQRGLVWNRSEADAKLRVINSGADISVPPGAMLVVGVVLAESEMMALEEGDCDVPCPSEEYYACCNYGGGDDPPSCTCQPVDGWGTDCDAGGSCSSYCHLDQGGPRNRCSVDCDDGCFACCSAGDDGLPTCTCRADGSGSAGCDSGGEGAPSCSQGQENPEYEPE